MTRIAFLAPFLAVAACIAAGGPTAAAPAPPSLIFASDRGTRNVGEVYAASLQRRSRVNLTRDPRHEERLGGVDPDTGRAFVVSDRSGRPALYVSRGRTLRPYAPLPHQAQSVYVWSRHGTTAVVSSMRSGFQVELRGPDGRRRPHVHTGQFYGLSADGQRVAYAGDGFVDVADADGQALWQRPGTGAVWATDAPRIAISGEVAVSGLPSFTLLADANGRTVRRFGGRLVALSPDGRNLVLLRAGERVVLASDTGQVRALPDGDADAAFSPDGRHVLLQYYSGPARVVSVATGQVRRIARGGRWLPDSGGLLSVQSCTRSSGTWLLVLDLRGRVRRRIELAPRALAVNALEITRSGTVVYGVTAIPRHQLYERRADGRVRRLTSGPFDHRKPAVTADGSRIVDTERVVGCQYLTLATATILPVDGSAPAQPLDVDSYPEAGRPSWSPDGTRVVFDLLDDHGRGVGLTVRRVDGSARADLEGTEGLTDPAWSPDGRWIVAGMELIRPDGSERRTLSAGPDASAPAWSPDSRRIAFADGDGTSVIAVDGTGLERILAVRNVHALAWSPDGSAIAFSAPCKPGCLTDDIWTVRPDGTGLIRVVDDLADDAWPTWRPIG
jgi:Tol biopolymer transport system component